MRFGRWHQGVESPGWTPNNSTIIDSAYSIWWDKKEITSGDTLTVNTRFGLSIPPTIETPKPVDERAPYDLMLQVGANAGEQFKVTLSDVRTTIILPDEIDISTDTGRKQFMESIDKAAVVISAERVKYGTYSNALEHIGSNVDNYNENMTASLSRIEDTDMAKEIIEKTKYDVLSNANFNMMTQAMKMNESMANIVTLWNK